MLTLRTITQAICEVRDPEMPDEERQRIFDRARMLRDKGLIASSRPRAPGKSHEYSEADAAAAVVALTASLEGTNWTIIGAVNDQLRAIGNTQGAPVFEMHIDRIKAGEPIYARLDVLLKPWPHAKAEMGGLEVLTREPADGTTQVVIWPVTDLAKPVLDLLASE